MVRSERTSVTGVAVDGCHVYLGVHIYFGGEVLLGELIN